MMHWEVRATSSFYVTVCCDALVGQGNNIILRNSVLFPKLAKAFPDVHAIVPQTPPFPPGPPCL